MQKHAYDRFVVYADREHSASLAYLTGSDPRFEEALSAPVPPPPGAGHDAKARASRRGRKSRSRWGMK
jgi:hypothetical protein